MKKILLLVSAVLLFAGCSSAKFELEQNTPMAIVTVKGNSSIQWIDVKNGEEIVSGDGLINKALNNRFYSTDPEVNGQYERMDYTEDAVRRIFAENLNIEVLEKADVLESKAYKSFSNALLSGVSEYIVATDYKMINSLARAQLRSLYKSTGAKSCIFVTINFYKKTIKGSRFYGEAAPFIRMKVKIYDNLANEVLYKSYEVTGSETVKIDGRDYDKEAFTALYPAAIDQIINKVTLDLIK